MWGFGAFARLIGFWTVSILLVLVSSAIFPIIDINIILETLNDVFSGKIEKVSDPKFAYALSGIIFAFSIGLSFSFFSFHVFPVIFTIISQKQKIIGRKNIVPAEIRKNFARNFEDIRYSLARNWLIGHAWTEFEDTLVDIENDHAIGNTVRPSIFFNPGLARGRLGGLKIMGAVPGYFVGIGLLLTFIGLVLALYKAGSAASVGDAGIMAAEMGQLLQIATFKFSTSIAGLLASIILSILFRFYGIWMEGAFDSFNTELERRLRYHAPQSISLEISRTMRDQLAQLKDITQGEFFARMGEEIAPRLHSAMADAMAPVTQQIGHAIGNLTTSSQDGVQKLLHSFTDSLKQGAGVEMRELAGTLEQLRVSMVEVQGGLRGTGEDFSAKLGEAADNLNRMVARAGQAFEQSSSQGRDALASVVESLRQTMEKANVEMDAALGQAASGASAKLEAAMGIVMQKFDQQLDTTLTSVSRRFSELSMSMQAIEGALTSQKAALEAASSEARKTAQAFGESALSIRAATAPLMTVGATFSGATEKLSESVSATLEALKGAKEEMEALAGGLAETNARSGNFWSSFSTKFDDVDSALGKAVETLARSTVEQQDRLRSHVKSVDEGLTEVIQKLNPLLTAMSESAEDIAESLQAASEIHGQAR